MVSMTEERWISPNYETPTSRGQAINFSVSHYSAKRACFSVSKPSGTCVFSNGQSGEFRNRDVNSNANRQEVQTMCAIGDSSLTEVIIDQMKCLSDNGVEAGVRLNYVEPDNL